MWQRARGVNNVSTMDQEIRRVLDLPVVGGLLPEEFEAMNERELLPDVFRSGFRLFPVQAEGVLAYDRCKGLFGPIGVGRGKALLSLMLASRAFFRGMERIVLFNPPQLITQLRQQALPWARTKVPIRCPFIYLEGKTPRQREGIAKRRHPGVYVMSYHLLSRPDTEDFLAALAPQFCIFDEAHYLKARKTTRTRRMMKYVKAAQPQTAWLSGTMTQKSIMDYHHMISAALGNKSPLPLPATIAESWACAVDAGAEETADNSTAIRGAALRPLISWSLKKGLDVPANLIGARRAYRFRLTTAPGVVSTPDDEIGVSLLVSNQPVENYKEHPDWEKLEELLNQVENDWVSPSGDEINHAFHKWRYLDELSAGFFNHLKWPTPEELAPKRKISEEEAADLIDRAKIHHEALQDYNKSLRKFLNTHHVKGLDTPMLVGTHLSNHGSKGFPGAWGKLLLGDWQEAKDLEFEGMPERQSVPVRICDYKIQHAVKWAKALKPGTGALIWYYHQDVGRWAHEELAAAGLPVVHCPAGAASNHFLANIEGHKDKIVVLSLAAHSEGKNLQCLQEQFYIQFPRSSKLAQQSIGRTHRSGQEADELTVTKCDTTPFDELNFAACLVDAAYQHGSGGNRQKLIYASYDPIPRIHPPEFLLERGLDVHQLDETERQLLTEKFAT